MIRSLHTLDFITLPKSGDSLSNEAKPRSRILGSRADLGEIFWPGIWHSLLRKRHTWIWVEGKSLHGLVSIRSRSSPNTWEVDYLLLPSGEIEHSRELLEMLGAEAGQAGAERIFLRVAEQSPVIPYVQQAGFCRCFGEFLYRYNGSKETGLSPKPIPGQLRSKKPGDEYGIFSMFNSLASQKVCQSMGVAFKDWVEARDVLWDGGMKRQLVYERGGKILGWLRLARYEGSVHADILADPSAEEAAQVLLSHILRSAKDGTPTFCLVPEFQDALRRLLQGEGFLEWERYAILMKQVTAKVRQPSLAPARVGG